MIKRMLISLISILINCFIIYSAGRADDEKNIKIIGVKEIKTVPFLGGNWGDNYFERISAFCCDKYGNLYAADSGMNRIIKMSPKHEYLGSFGREGQGPGEFLAKRVGGRLEISYGNDDRFYITDYSSRRISIFNESTLFERGLKLPEGLFDSPIVNSEGDIYINSSSDKYSMISKYDRNLNILGNILPQKEHYASPYYPNIDWQKYQNIISYIAIEKRISKYDELIVLSNISVTLFKYGKNGELINKFKISNAIYDKDIKTRINKNKKTNVKNDSKNISATTVMPFDLNLDNENNICLGYFNSSLNNWEIYRYKATGQLIEVLRFPEKVSRPIFFESNGDIVATLEDKASFKIFKIY